MTLLRLTFVLLLDACAAQLHGTLSQPVSIECFHCDAHARHFPACLSESFTCHPDEVCSVTYGNGLPTLKCQKTNECTHDVSHFTHNCTGGGVEVHPNQCELCCHTTACVQAINGLLLQEFPPVVQQGPVQCFHCDNHARHFPDCLSEPVTCHADEVCSISYGDGLPLIGCEKTKDCTQDVSHPMRNCTGGGVEVHANQCQLCCHSTPCVQEINGLLLQEFPNHGVLCPGSCSETDINTCVHTAAYCHADQFCEVGISDHLIVQGHCQLKHDIQKCSDDKAKHPCVLTVGQTGHTAKCVWDCCETTECLAGHFGAYMDMTTLSQMTLLSQTPAPATPAPTTISPIKTELITAAQTTQAPTAPALTPISTTAPIDKPFTCTKCDGACPNNEMDVSCPDGFCSLTVDDGAGGSRSVKKGCSNQNKCTIFFSEWDANPVCHDILAKPGTPSFQDASCSYCCTGDNCNTDFTHMNVFRAVRK